MSIPLSAGTAASAIGGTAGVPDSAKGKGDGGAPQQRRRSPYAAYSAAGLPASLTVSIGSQSAPLSLVFKSALTSIGEALHQQDDGSAANSALLEDTPQSTASRIVALTGGLFDAFCVRHADQPAPALLERFMATLRGGSLQGFAEARSILRGLSALQGMIAANIDQTEALVRQGYDDFEAAQRGAQLQEPVSEPAPESSVQPQAA